MSSSALVASPRPSGVSPLIRSRPPQSSSGRRARSWSDSRPISAAKPLSCITCIISSASCACCSADREFISRWAAAARRASESTSSSSVCGLSGKKSP